MSLWQIIWNQEESRDAYTSLRRHCNVSTITTKSKTATESSGILISKIIKFRLTWSCRKSRTDTKHRQSSAANKRKSTTTAFQRNYAWWVIGAPNLAPITNKMWSHRRKKSTSIWWRQLTQEASIDSDQIIASDFSWRSRMKKLRKNIAKNRIPC